MEDREMSVSSSPVALITGAALRIGRAIATQLHEDGYVVMLHYHNSKEAAYDLAAILNEKRQNSAVVYQESLSMNFTIAGETAESDVTLLCTRCRRMIDYCFDTFGRCDVLINNASAYFPTPLVQDGAPEATVHAALQDDTDVSFAAADIFGSNALAPYYLTRAFAHRQKVEHCKQFNVSIVNLLDAMAQQPLETFSMYTMSKHALEGLTKASALELAPRCIRVNAVAPGLSVLPCDMPLPLQEEFRSKVPLGKTEAPCTLIANTVSFLVSDKAKYITGSTVKVDGAWSLTRA